jgi:Methyltransferase domain
VRLWKGCCARLGPAYRSRSARLTGGSLRSIARYSGHVHSVDLAVPPDDINELTNVTVHAGDSHVLLPEVLAEIARDGQNVDFVLVDGDHTAEGVERDTRDLLASAAVNTTVIVFHDTMNDDVRAGLAHIDIEAESKVTYYDPDFLGGRLHYRSDLHISSGVGSV